MIPPAGAGMGAGGSGVGGQGGSGGRTTDTPMGNRPGGGSGGFTSMFGGPSSAAAVLARLMPTMVVTTGGVAMTMAFLAFGRRRRDGSPTASDQALAAAAATGMPRAAASQLVPKAVLVADAARVATAVRAAAAAPAVAGPVDTDVPRWRRPSLMEARKADPARMAGAAVSLTFSGQAGEAVSGLERRRVRYRLVSLLDQPDDVRGIQIGSLDDGDEVVLLERLGTYWRVLCPDGREGWVHKMVLGDLIDDDPPPAPAASRAGGSTWTSGDEGPAPGTFDDVLRMYSERRRQFGEA